MAPVAGLPGIPASSALACPPEGRGRVSHPEAIQWARSLGLWPGDSREPKPPW
jgi:hypothetical protein